MTRKLLPFEHDLIAALGVSKKEYLEFLALQEEVDFGEQPVAGPLLVPIILTVVGVVFQVASALLAPRPSIPRFNAPEQATGGQAQSRDERFSPRFGFNSQQELAAYGDPINLIYANRGTAAGANPNGGVRVTTSLIWSAVRSYGSSQFIQMLTLLSGGAVTAIDNDKSAFGQTPVRDLATQNIWMYFNPSGTGFLQRNNELRGSAATDPTAYGAGTDNPYRIQPSTANTRIDGFSQAYSPTTANTIGIYGVVPLNVNVYLRNSTGDKEAANLGIFAYGLSWVAGTGTRISVGQILTIGLQATNTDNADSDVIREAKDARRSLSSVFDSASIFKLGTAVFRVKTLGATSIDDGQFVIDLECIQAGRAPTAAYSSVDPSTTRVALTEEELAEYNRIRPTAINLLNADQRPDVVLAGALADSGGIYVANYRTNREFLRSFDGIGPQRQGWRFSGYDRRTGQIIYYRDTQVIAGYSLQRSLTSDEKQLLYRFGFFEALIDGAGRRDDIFYTKALVRIATAKYETISPCHIVDFALKATVYKRINGRQQEYGSGRRPGYPVSDNGLKNRVSLFKLRYRQVGRSQFITVSTIFAITRAADNESFVYFRFNSRLTDPAKAVHWEFELEPISDPLAEIDVNDRYYYLENNGTAVSATLPAYPLLDGTTVIPTLEFTGRALVAGDGAFPPQNNNPADLNEWDLFNYDSDTQIQFSFDSGPEIAITAVTEQLAQSFSDYNVTNSSGQIIQRLYQNLALFGFNAHSGKTIQDLRSFSIFATQGRSVRRLRTSGNDEDGRTWGSAGYRYYPSNPDGASSLAPDIFLDTVLDKQDGIGNFAVVGGLDLRQLALTKRFCIRNNLFMDCVIASPRSWREFWVEVAPFSLLEFARIGGRETLVPAVPYDQNTGAITRTVNISAIFNTGNILEDSYKEEYIDYGSNVQDIIASVIYTEVPADAVFAKKRSVEIQRRDTIEADAIRQTFDLSAYVSNAEQAILFGKLICNTRRYVRQAVEFKTYPTSDPISPGAFIYVDIGQNTWDAIRTGVVQAGGALNAPLNDGAINGNFNVQLYRSDRGLVTLRNVQITNNSAPALAAYEGFLFVLGVEATTRRVFRVSEVQMDEEGETTIRASSYPCTTDGLSLLADFSDTLFTVRR